MDFKKRLVTIIITTLFLGTVLFRLIVLVASITNLMLSYNKPDYNCQSVSSSWDPVKVTQTIVDYSPEFEPLKVFENIYSWGPIYSLENDVYFVGSLSKTENTQLLNFNIESERLNWQICETEAMILDQDRVYVGHTDFAGAFIIAIDAMTGERIWYTKVDHRAVSNIEVSSNGLLVTTNDHGDKRYYLVDAETGEREKAFQDYYAKNEFLINSGQTVYQQTPQGLSVTGNVNWEIKFANVADRREITTTLIDNILLIDVRDRFISQIYAVDNLNGKILWHTERNVKSNLAINDDVGYFLTHDSVFKAIDLFTGTIIGKIYFSPRLDAMPDLDYVNADPRVSVNEDVVIVYFDNSRQLFAFRFLPSK